MKKKNSPNWPLIIIVTVYVIAVPFWIYMAWQNHQTEKRIERTQAETSKTLLETDSMLDENIKKLKAQNERLKNMKR